VNALALLAAVGFAVAAGLNASLALLVVAILASGGSLRGPLFGALGSPGAIAILVPVALVEFIADKAPGAGRLVRPLLLTGAIAAGTFLWTAEAAPSGHPPSGIQLLALVLPGAAIAGSVHAARALIRPPMTAAGFGMQASWVEDLAACGLATVAGAGPLLVPVALALLAALVYDAARRLAGAGQILLSLVDRWVARRWPAGEDAGFGRPPKVTVVAEPADEGTADEGTADERRAGEPPTGPHDGDSPPPSSG
jgi:hypothetical protein